MIQHRIPYKGLLLRHEPPTSNCTCPVAFYSKIPVLLCGISRLLHTPISAFSVSAFPSPPHPSTRGPLPHLPRRNHRARGRLRPISPQGRPTDHCPPPSSFCFQLSAYRSQIGRASCRE